MARKYGSASRRTRIGWTWVLTAWMLAGSAAAWAEQPPPYPFEDPYGRPIYPDSRGAPPPSGYGTPYSREAPPESQCDRARREGAAREYVRYVCADERLKEAQRRAYRDPNYRPDLTRLKKERDEAYREHQAAMRAKKRQPPPPQPQSRPGIPAYRGPFDCAGPNAPYYPECSRQRSEPPGGGPSFEAAPRPVPGSTR